MRDFPKYGAARARAGAPGRRTARLPRALQGEERGERECGGEREEGGAAVNKRFIVAGAILGTIVVVAFLLGSPMFGGYDSFR